MTFLEELALENERLKFENYNDLIENIDNYEYSFKIKRWAEKFNFSESEVKNEILRNKMFAMNFIKDPKKQNISEKVAQRLLGIKTLPQSGSKAIRFLEDGSLTNQKSYKATKSVDFIINGVYYTQKFTCGEGGAQDNQFQDVLYFLMCGSLKYKVGAILDGDYYEAKRETLKNYYLDNKNVKITSVDELRGEIK